MGMGRVGVAAPSDNAAITLNPGLLGLRERYDFHAHFRLGPAGPAPRGEVGGGLGLQWAASAMDARTSSAVALGFAYSGDRFDAPLADRDLPGWWIPGEEITNRKRYQDFAGGLAIPLLDRHLSVGLGGDVGLYDHDRQGEGLFWDLHLGVGLQPTEGLTLGLSARDLLPGDGEDRPMQLLAGLRAEDQGNLAFEINAGHTWVDAASPLSLRAGLEKILGHAELRLGGGWSGPEGQTYATAGIGTSDEGGGLEYGVAVPLSPDPSPGALLHQISIRFGAPAPIDPL
ncbi:MAG TPA: hypothetical protein ENK18_25580 [Deltaproteobacteria bacterium]|nr:hypothetical protein [Deltaproteobacteria bacterium]